MQIVTHKYHVDDSTKYRHAMILGRYLLKALGIYITFSNHIVSEGDGTYIIYMAPMVDLNNFNFKLLN